jgi:hypothetical protein
MDDLKRYCGYPALGPCSWLSILLHHTPMDPTDGHRPLPWLTPSLTQAEGTLSWTSSGNMRSIRHNKTPLVLPGGDHQRDTTTLCDRGWRGNLSALLIPHSIHSLF